MAVDKIFRPRRGKQATMESAGTVLKKGEMFFEVPTGGVGSGQCRIKMGDGSSAYSALPYAINLDNCVASGSVGSEKVTFTASTSTTNATLLSEISSGATVATLMGSIKTLLTNLNTSVTELNNDMANITDAIDNVSESFGFTEVTTANTSLDDYRTSGVYHFSVDCAPTDTPVGTNGWLLNMASDDNTTTHGCKQLWYRHGTANSNDWQQYQRTYSGTTWSSWTKNMNWNTERVVLTTSDGGTMGYKWGRAIVYIFNGLTSDGLTSELQSNSYTPTKTFSVPLIITRSGNYYLGYAYICSTASDSYVAYFASYGASSATKISASSDTCYGTCAYITNIND